MLPWRSLCVYIDEADMLTRILNSAVELIRTTDFWDMKHIFIKWNHNQFWNDFCCSFFICSLERRRNEREIFS